jgi:hypothetical protein
MTINMFFMILTIAMPLGSPSIETSSTTTDEARPASNCYRNGIWYNPCPPETAPSPPPPAETPEIDQ